MPLPACGQTLPTVYSLSTNRHHGATKSPKPAYHIHQSTLVHADVFLRCRLGTYEVWLGQVSETSDSNSRETALTTKKPNRPGNRRPGSGSSGLHTVTRRVVADPGVVLAALDGSRRLCEMLARVDQKHIEHSLSVAGRATTISLMPEKAGILESFMKMLERVARVLTVFCGRVEEDNVDEMSGIV